METYFSLTHTHQYNLGAPCLKHIANDIETLDKQNYSRHNLIFSSPEHEVLKVSYCDRPMSVVSCVVRRAASTICFKSLLYYSYTPELIDSKLGRKHRDDL